ncbi:TPA: hypothetical protein HA219_01995 [Candidatus Woesearchaeota archaeon]|nr:hypothetical protein [Candidatus Woesearchaeota archaeon]HIH39472.1 hypothetical protein [Candidatus Woesearchaeota archaeon]
MKKITMPKYSYFLWLVLFISSAFALTIMTGGSIKAIPGSKDAVFPINLNNEENIAGFQLDINYSTNDLILIGIEPTSRLYNATIIFNNQPPIVKVAVLVNNEDSKILPGNGPILNLIFDVNDSAQSGDYEVNFDELVAVNISAIVLNVSDVRGLFRIVEPYDFEFLPPISTFENFTLQESATLPLKFTIANESGFVADESVLVRVYNLSLGIDNIYNASGAGDDYITIDEENSLYIINIHAGQLNMPKGNYDIDVSFDNYQLESVGFEILNKSNGLAKGKQK